VIIPRRGLRLRRWEESSRRSPPIQARRLTPPMHWRRADYVKEFFTDLAVSMSERLTQYVNRISSSRARCADPVTGVAQTPATITKGYLFIAVTACSRIVPLLAILLSSSRAATASTDPGAISRSHQLH
jgi:hypothetical protein